MTPVYLDLHIHTSDPPTPWNNSYNVQELVTKIGEVSADSPFLISFTDHNTLNIAAYLEAAKLGINIIPGVELHIKNYSEADAYHCHIYFNIEKITEEVLLDLNKKLDELYPNKVVKLREPSLPKIDAIINTFEGYDFLLLPHGGQSHCRFDMSIPEGVKFDNTIERGIYYNQFDGFTARGNTGLEKTQQYFKRLGINDFVNLVTCTDNYSPQVYPKAKPKETSPFVPTWMMAEPTFDGLRLSLSESSRLIYSVKKPEVWSEQIRSVKHTKENIDIDVRLTLGLNVVIGGSSSGKTLLVDSIYRSICNDFSDCKYTAYQVDKCLIDNPSGIIPHYLSQNYIMSVVNEVTDDKIDNIDIIKNVFPGDKEISAKIEANLSSLKKQLRELVGCVKEIEKQDKVLSKIPHISRLITQRNVEVNIFEKLLPSAKEKSAIEYAEHEFDEHTGILDDIENLLVTHPFVTHDKTLVPKLKKELQQAMKSADFSEKIRSIIVAHKNKLAAILRAQNAEEQSKHQHFEEMLEAVRIYVAQSRKFKRILNDISKYAVKFDSQQIESMGHKLYIENGFALNKELFLEIINKYLKTESRMNKFSEIVPERLFESNCFRKQNPKVQNYEDFERRVYKDFEELNKKVYKIITNDGRNFENLSAGWKTSVILDLILGYDKDIAPVIIDQPEDNLATTYINTGLVAAIKRIKTHKQIILVSHNATIPMLADAQNIVLCNNTGNKIVIRSGSLEGSIDGKKVLDHIAEITDGGKSSVKKRVKKYNLKNFKD